MAAQPAARDAGERCTPRDAPAPVHRRHGSRAHQQPPVQAPHRSLHLTPVLSPPGRAAELSGSGQVVGHCRKAGASHGNRGGRRRAGGRRATDRACCPPRHPHRPLPDRHRRRWLPAPSGSVGYGPTGTDRAAASFRTRLQYPIVADRAAEPTGRRTPANPARPGPAARAAERTSPRQHMLPGACAPRRISWRRHRCGRSPAGPAATGSERAPAPRAPA